MLMPNSQIRLAIADKHEMVRQGLLSLISTLGSIRVDIEAANGKELIAKLHAADQIPDVCILDVNMLGKSGWETIKDIKSSWPKLKVLVLSQQLDHKAVGIIASSGANGYISKDEPIERLINGICEVHESNYYFPPSIVMQLLGKHNDDKKLPNEKELIFLSHCCEENGYKEIADKMGVSTRTIESYRDSLFEKLNVKTRIGLAIYAIRTGIASLSDK